MPLPNSEGAHMQDWDAQASRLQKSIRGRVWHDDEIKRDYDKSTWDYELGADGYVVADETLRTAQGTERREPHLLARGRTPIRRASAQELNTVSDGTINTLPRGIDARGRPRAGS
jgi:hypothetical protein